MVRKFIIASCAALSLAPLADAAPNCGDWVLSPQVGKAYFDNERTLDNPLVLGLGVSRWMSPDWRLGVNFNHFAAHNDVTNTDFSIDGYDLQVYRYFGEADRDLRVFAMAGLGYWAAPGQPEMPRSSRFIDLGLGFDYSLSERMSLQLDARHFFTKSGENNFDDVVVMASLNLHFPKKVKHAHREGARLKAKLAQAGPLPLIAPTLFGFDSTQVQISEGAEAWHDMVAYLEEHPNAKVILEGHTDGKGPERYNEKLGLRRAESVKEFLLNNTSVKQSQITLKSQGSKMPIADNDTEEGRALNRRVSFQVVPEGIDVDRWWS